MPNPLIIQNKYDSLNEGYPVFINTDDIRAFTVLKTSVGIPCVIQLPLIIIGE